MRAMGRHVDLQVELDALADGGVGALTMRALARRLQVAPNALYSHVPDKTALLDLLLDELLASVPAPAADAEDPVAALEELMSTTYDILLAHPALVPLYLARQGARGPHAIRLGKVMDALLARAGVVPNDAVAARRVLIIHTIGSAAFATGPRGARTTQRGWTPTVRSRASSPGTPSPVACAGWSPASSAKPATHRLAVVRAHGPSRTTAWAGPRVSGRRQGSDTLSFATAVVAFATVVVPE